MSSTPYDGTGPFPGRSPLHAPLQLWVTVAIVLGPLIGLAAAVWTLWGRGLGVTDVSLALLFYLITGFGITAGFHRYLTHGGYRARPGLRAALAVAGSMGFQGDVIGWVATHRRHHAFTDRPGDPHSPHRYGTGTVALLRGLAHAHVGWLFGDDPTSAERFAPDLLADPVIGRISRAFPYLCVASLALPALAGWAISGGDPRAALTAFLWAGLVRVLLLQHVTWSVNSLCHLFGNRPFATRRHDRATNLWPLALVSLGESWHNLHHAEPTCARHGVDRGQLDATAALIRAFERLGWAHDVRWPTSARLDQRRHQSDEVAPSLDEAEPVDLRQGISPR